MEEFSHWTFTLLTEPCLGADGSTARSQGQIQWTVQKQLAPEHSEERNITTNKPQKEMGLAHNNRSAQIWISQSFLMRVNVSRSEHVSTGSEVK